MADPACSDPACSYRAEVATLHDECKANPCRCNRLHVELSNLHASLERLREGLERIALWPCAKFPKEQQPNRFNCLSIRADHRCNADEYTAESNAEAEQLCDTCFCRSLLSPDPISQEGEV